MTEARYATSEWPHSIHFRCRFSVSVNPCFCQPTALAYNSGVMRKATGLAQGVYVFTVHARWRCAFVVIAVVTIIGCHRQSTGWLTADISTSSVVPGAPPLSGKLYVRGKHLRADWGQFADVFDLQQRNGWRVIASMHGYQELGSKDLSTYAPEMVNGSPCPHAQVPSACKLIGNESIEGRAAKKWDVYNPNGFHVYFWTDNALGLTLRMAMGDDISYEAKNLREKSVAESMFELPAGYEKLDRPFRP